MGLGEIPEHQSEFGLGITLSLTSILSSHLLSVSYDLIPDLAKVVELLSGQM
jgi:hypothetical protein